MHLNDTMNPFASNKDRHAKIAHGDIGLEAIVRVILHPALSDKPFFLETPHEELSGYGEEIKLIKEHI